MTCTGTGLSSLGVTTGFKDLESSGHLGCVFGRVADKNFLNRPKNGYLTLIKKESLVIKKRRRATGDRDNRKNLGVCWIATVECRGEG